MLGKSEINLPSYHYGRSGMIAVEKKDYIRFLNQGNNLVSKILSAVYVISIEYIEIFFLQLFADSFYDFRVFSAIADEYFHKCGHLYVINSYCFYFSAFLTIMVCYFC